MKLRVLEVCYHYSHQLYAVDIYPHSGLSFCEKHIHPETHLSLASAKQSACAEI